MDLLKKLRNLVGMEGNSKEGHKPEQILPLPPSPPLAWRNRYFESRKVVLMNHDERERHYQKTLDEYGQKDLNELVLAVETWRERGDAREGVLFVGSIPALREKANQLEAKNKELKNTAPRRQRTSETLPMAKAATTREEASEVLKMNR